MDKLASVASIVIAVAVIVLAVVQLLGIWSDAGYVYVPLMGINLLLQAYTQWNVNRKIAVFTLCASVFVLICAAVVYILR